MDTVQGREEVGVHARARRRRDEVFGGACNLSGERGRRASDGGNGSGAFQTSPGARGRGGEGLRGQKQEVAASACSLLQRAAWSHGGGRRQGKVGWARWASPRAKGKPPFSFLFNL